MSSLTRDKDSDRIILQKLNDYELGKVCSVNKYVNSICNDDFFWLNRLLIVFNLSAKEVNNMKKYLGFNTYKELYKFLRTFPVELFSRQKSIKIDRLYVINLFKEEKMIDNVIEKNLQPIMPEWIDREKLIYAIRRKFSDMLLDRKRTNDKKLDIGISQLLDKLNNVVIRSPGRTYENAKNYDEFNF